eukprot:6647286-Karenia_brevis.AAC.1
MHRLSDLLSTRRLSYIDFISQVHLIIARVYIAAQSLKSSPAFVLSRPALQTPEFVTFVSPPYTSHLMFLALSYKAHAQMIDLYLASAPACIVGFHTLISSHRVSCSGASAGLSWLELYILSVALVDSAVSLTHGCTAAAAKTIAAQLSEFTTHAHHFVHFALPPHFYQLFKSPEHDSSRMLLFGITSHLSHTCLFVDLPTDCLEALQLVVLQLTTPLSRTQLASYAEGTLQLRSHKFTGHCAMRCRQPLLALSNRMRQCSRVFAVARQPGPAKHTVFACPSGHTRPSCKPFDILRPTKQVWCKSCARPLHGGLWICPCGKKWHKCTIHFSAVFEAPGPGPGVNPRPSTNNDESAIFDHGDLMRARSDVRLNNLEPHRASRLLLGPTLAARFPHLQYSAL